MTYTVGKFAPLICILAVFAAPAEALAQGALPGIQITPNAPFVPPVQVMPGVQIGPAAPAPPQGYPPGQYPPPGYPPQQQPYPGYSVPGQQPPPAYAAPVQQQLPPYLPGQQPPPGYVLVPGQQLPPPGQPLPPYVTPGKPPPAGQAAPAAPAPQAAPQQQALAPPAAPTAMPSVAEMSFFVGADVNPDMSGRPSPVIVRTYELKSLVAFNGADFFSMFEREKEIIGPDLVARDEWALMPGNNRQVIKNLQKETRYVGVVAAFRDLDRSQWRAATLILPNQTTRVEIRLDRNELNVRLH